MCFSSMRWRRACPGIRIPATRLRAFFWVTSIAASCATLPIIREIATSTSPCYAQDDWKATRKLTLNYGLRYDVYFPRYEKNDNLSSFDPTIPNPAAGGRLGALAFLGEGPGRSGRNSFADTYWKAFGPRFGLAYQITDKTVLRSGYGIYYAQGNANAGLRDSLSASSRLCSQSVPSPLRTRVSRRHSTGTMASLRTMCGRRSSILRRRTEPTLRPILRDDGRPPYFQNWSFTVEREIVPRFNVELTYLGTKGTALGNGLIQMNELDPSFLSLGTLLSRPFNSPEAIAAGIQSPYPGFTGSVAQALRPYPQYLDLSNRSNPSGSSTYHALQTQVSIRALAGLDVQMAYTFAKTISDSDILAGVVRLAKPPINRRLEKAIATTDVPHVFALSYSYELPFMRSQ